MFYLYPVLMTQFIRFFQFMACQLVIGPFQAFMAAAESAILRHLLPPSSFGLCVPVYSSGFRQAISARISAFIAPWADEFPLFLWLLIHLITSASVLQFSFSLTCTVLYPSYRSWASYFEFPHISASFSL